MKINSFDIDGVITVGLYPGPNDVIITGRSFEERPETERMLMSKGIMNRVFYNPLPFDEKSRVTSGQHKARVIADLIRTGSQIGIHFEDDPVQWEVIERECPSINVVHIVHELTEKENVRHE